MYSDASGGDYECYGGDSVGSGDGGCIVEVVTVKAMVVVVDLKVTVVVGVIVSLMMAAVKDVW